MSARSQWPCARHRTVSWWNAGVGFSWCNNACLEKGWLVMCCCLQVNCFIVEDICKSFSWCLLKCLLFFLNNSPAFWICFKIWAVIFQSLVRWMNGYVCCVRSEVLTAMTVKNAISWDVTVCGSCKNQSFGEKCRLRHRGDKKRWARNVSSN
jgi:hypothetical protein